MMPREAKTEMIKAQGGPEGSPEPTGPCRRSRRSLRGGFRWDFKHSTPLSLFLTCMHKTFTNHQDPTDTRACTHSCLHSPRIHGHLPTRRLPGALTFLSGHLLPFRSNHVQSQGTECISSPASQHHLTSQSSNSARTLPSSQANTCGRVAALSSMKEQGRIKYFNVLITHPPALSHSCTSGSLLGSQDPALSWSPRPVGAPGGWGTPGQCRPRSVFFTAVPL